MSITALDIQQQSFGTSRHGYDPEEVDVFLERIATEIDNMGRFIADAGARLRAAEDRVTQAEERAVQAEQKARVTASNGITEDSISKAFINAQRSADALMEEARREGEKVYREAESKARDIIHDSLTEKQAIISEIDRLRESCEKFRTEYLSLLNHFQADAQKLLPVMDELMPQGSNPRPAAPVQSFVADNNAAAPGASEQKEAAEPVVYASTSPAVVAAAPAETAILTPVVSRFPEDDELDDFDLYDEDDDLDIEEID